MAPHGFQNVFGLLHIVVLRQSHNQRPSLHAKGRCRLSPHHGVEQPHRTGHRFLHPDMVHIPGGIHRNQFCVNHNHRVRLFHHHSIAAAVGAMAGNQCIGTLAALRNEQQDIFSRISKVAQHVLRHVISKNNRIQTFIEYIIELRIPRRRFGGQNGTLPVMRVELYIFHPAVGGVVSHKHSPADGGTADILHIMAIGRIGAEVQRIISVDKYRVNCPAVFPEALHRPRIRNKIGIALFRIIKAYTVDAGALFQPNKRLCVFIIFAPSGAYSRSRCLAVCRHIINTTQFYAGRDSQRLRYRVFPRRDIHDPSSFPCRLKRLLERFGGILFVDRSKIRHIINVHAGRPGDTLPIGMLQTTADRKIQFGIINERVCRPVGTVDILLPLEGATQHRNTSASGGGRDMFGRPLELTLLQADAAPMHIHSVLGVRVPALKHTVGDHHSAASPIGNLFSNRAADPEVFKLHRIGEVLSQPHARLTALIPFNGNVSERQTDGIGIFNVDSRFAVLKRHFHELCIERSAFLVL